MFLSAIGIRSQFLPEDFIRVAQSQDSKNGYPLRNEVAWLQSQLALSSFAGGRIGKDDRSFAGADVVIASPSAFGSDEGLGLEGAETIVVLDTDWSGRDSLHLDFLIKRWMAQKSQTDKDSNLIRLVCADTIETRLFSSTDKCDKNFKWPLDEGGFQSVPEIEKDATALFSKAVRDHESPSSFASVMYMKGECEAGCS